MERVSALGVPSINYRQVFIQTHVIMASKFARPWTPSTSPNSLDYGLQVHLQIRSTTASKLTQSPPLSAYLQTLSITTSKCVSKLTQSWPPSVCPSSLDYGLHSISPNTLHYCFQGHLQTRWITASECVSEFTRLSFSDSPRIALKLRL
jgi:hypothetical protein